jgi:hypothetical protein
MIPSSFRLARYRFTLTARDPIRVPPFKGSTLRGGFGHAFKHLVCFQPEVKTCASCLLRYTCPYSYVFETPVPPDAEVLSKNDRAPRPLVIEPPLDRRTDYPPGERLTFHVTLVGRAMDFLPYFLVAFQELGRQGLGRERGRFKLSRVEALAPFGEEAAPVYDEAQPAHIHARALPADWDSVEARAAQLPPDHVTLTFLTPARLKHKGRWVRQGPPFGALVKVLLGRVSSLSYFHCGERLEVDFRGLIDRAAEVHIAQSETHWEDWSRFSGRQKQRVEMGGLVGRVTYEGDLREYLPLLALGELVHVGKGTVFGNGQMSLCLDERTLPCYSYPRCTS